MFEQLKMALDGISNANTPRGGDTTAAPKVKKYGNRGGAGLRGDVLQDRLRSSRLRNILRGRDRGDISKSTSLSRIHLSCAWRHKHCREFYVSLVDPTDSGRRDLDSCIHRSEHDLERCTYCYADSGTYCFQTDREFCSHLYEDYEMTEDAVVAVTVSDKAATAVAILVNGPPLKDTAALAEAVATQIEDTDKQPVSTSTAEQQSADLD